MKTEHDASLEAQLRLALAPAGEPAPELKARIRSALAGQTRRRFSRSALLALAATAFLAAGTIAYALLNDTDHRRELAAENEQLHFCETEDTIYFTKWSMMGSSLNELICFADKATGVTAPLCGRPECDHTGSGCNACVGGMVLGLAVYDGHLYAANAKGDIWRMNMDGTDHVLVRSIDPGVVFVGGGSSGQFWFHRGCAYHLAESTTVSGGVYTQGVKAYAVSLTDPEEEPVVILREQYPGKGMTARFHLAEDSLFICVNLWDDPNRTTAGENALRIYRWDIETRSLETVYDGAGPISVEDMWAGPDGLLLAGSRGDRRGIYWLDFATGQIGQRFGLDKNWYRTTFAQDRIIVESWDPQPEVLVYRVMDQQGNTLQETRIDVPVEEEPAGPDSTFDWWNSFTFGADGQYLYGALYHDLGTTGGNDSLLGGTESVRFFQLSLQTGEYSFIGRYETSREG